MSKRTGVDSANSTDDNDNNANKKLRDELHDVDESAKRVVKSPLSSTLVFSTTGLKTGNVTAGNVKEEDEAESKSPKNEDLYQFFLRAGYNQERSVCLSNYFPSRINRMNLIYYYSKYSDKLEFYQFLERIFDITNEIDKIPIYSAIKRYGKLKFEFMVHCFHHV